MSPVNSDFNTGDTITKLENLVERTVDAATFNPERGVFLISDRAHQHYTREMERARLADMESQANQCAQMDGE